LFTSPALNVFTETCKFVDDTVIVTVRVIRCTSPMQTPSAGGVVQGPPTLATPVDIVQVICGVPAIWNLANAA
jgi:hypothetical protein